VEGSIERDLSAKVVRFRVRSTPHGVAGSGEDVLPVVYASLETPDLFKDGAEVVVEGRLVGGDRGTFEASHILAKCPSKFEAKAGGRAAL
jgi:cytochrome c-type biogenesis protein CcmE